MALLVDVPAVHRLDAGTVRVSGPDRLSYLHTLLTQHLADAVTGTVADFLYLDAKGNAQAAGRAVVRDADVLLVTPPGVAADLAAALERYRFLTDVAAVDVSGEYAAAAVRGPQPAAVPGAPEAPMTAAPLGAGVAVRDRSGGVDLVGPPAWLDERLAALGLPKADAEDWRRWRVTAGVPGWGSEVGAGFRAQELGLLPTHVHLRKGCYPGQESIAKIYNLGRPRRALAVVAFDGAVGPGDRVGAGGKTGTVTSAVRAGDGWLALAMLPLDRDGGVAGDGTVTAGAAAGAAAGAGEGAGGAGEGGGGAGEDPIVGRVLRLVGEGLPQPGV